MLRYVYVVVLFVYVVSVCVVVCRCVVCCSVMLGGGLFCFDMISCESL